MFGGWKGGNYEAVKQEKRVWNGRPVLPFEPYDNMDTESNSISNQKKILQKAAKEKGYTDTLFFVDDSDIVEPSQEELAGQAFSGLVQLFAFYRQ